MKESAFDIYCNELNQAVAWLLMFYHQVCDDGRLGLDQTVYSENGGFDPEPYVDIEIECPSLEGKYDVSFIRQASIIHILCDLADSVVESGVGARVDFVYFQLRDLSSAGRLGAVPEVGEIIGLFGNKMDDDEFDYARYNTLIDRIYQKYVYSWWLSVPRPSSIGEMIEGSRIPGENEGEKEAELSLQASHVKKVMDKSAVDIDCNELNQAVAWLLLFYHQVCDDGRLGLGQTVCSLNGGFDPEPYVDIEIERPGLKVDYDVPFIRQASIIHILCDLADSVVESGVDAQYGLAYSELRDLSSAGRLGAVPEVEEIMGLFGNKMDDDEFDYTRYNALIDLIYQKYVYSWWLSVPKPSVIREAIDASRIPGEKEAGLS
ncbi:MAG: hypothetical protein CSB44_11800 [Gammaproteobacteria bacterium]|nr:MAG: hypothetical protein CSB44_11800 [Gammaproteobacteria bacterium]